MRSFIVCDSATNSQNLSGTFIAAHPMRKYTLEVEENNVSGLLDVDLRRIDNMREWIMFLKRTWVGQYTHFPLPYKRTLMCCLILRSGNICSREIIQQELEHMQDVMWKNGYPEPFIRWYMKKKYANREVNQPKWRFFRTHPVKGDEALKTLKQHLPKAPGRSPPCVLHPGLI